MAEDKTDVKGPEENKNVMPRNITDEMRTSYIDYSVDQYFSQC